MAKNRNDKNKILEDSALKLSVEMDDAAIAASNAAAALDLTTDAAADLADKQEKLGYTVRDNIDVGRESVKVGEKVNDITSREIDVKSRYVQSMEDRIALEQKLQKERPIVRYSDYANGQVDGSDEQLHLTQEQLLVMKKLYDIVGDKMSVNNTGVTVDSTATEQTAFKKETSGFTANFAQPTSVKLISNSGIGLDVLDKMADVLEPGVSPTPEPVKQPIPEDPKPVPSKEKTEQPKPQRTKEKQNKESDKPSFFSRVVSFFSSNEEDSKEKMKRYKKEDKRDEKAKKENKDKKKRDDASLNVYLEIANSIRGVMGILATIRALTLASLLTSMPALIAIVAAVGVGLAKALYDYKEEILVLWDKMGVWLDGKLSSWGHDLGKWSGDLINDIIDEMPGWVDSMWKKFEDVFGEFLTVLKRQMNKVATAVGMDPIFADVEPAPTDDRPFMEKLKENVATAQKYTDKINPLGAIQRKLSTGIADGLLESKLRPRLDAAGAAISDSVTDSVDYLGKKWDSVTNFFGDDSEVAEQQTPVIQNIQSSTVPQSEVANVLEQQVSAAEERRAQVREQRTVAATVAAVKSTGGVSVMAPQTNNTYVVGGAGFPGDYAMQPQRFGAQPRR